MRFAMRFLHTDARCDALTPPFRSDRTGANAMTSPHTPAEKETTMYRVNVKPTHPVNGWQWRGLVSEEDGAPVLERADPTPRTPSEDVRHDPEKNFTR